MTATEPYEPCRERARRAYQDALLAEVPPMARLELTLAAYTEALIAAGHLSDATTPEQAARTLAGHAAAAGGHRYGGDGWQHPLASPRDVKVAYAKAVEASPADDEITREVLVAARRRLAEHHRDTTPSHTTGG